jgi:hypothetical protein
MTFNLKKYSQEEIVEEVPEELPEEVPDVLPAETSEISSEIEPNSGIPDVQTGDEEQKFIFDIEKVAQRFKELLEHVPPDRIADVTEEAIIQLHNSLTSEQL